MPITAAFSRPIVRLALAAACVLVLPGVARGRIGADLAWTTYEAESMTSTGTVLGPCYEPYRVETESSGQRCVKLAAAGEYVEFAAKAKASALVIRCSVPDAPNGGGTTTALELLVNGRPVRTLSFSSRYSWLYGQYPFSNRPADGKPRNFYDELRVKNLAIAAGDVVRLRKFATDEPPCIVDLVDLEDVPPPALAPAEALSIADFGADGRGATDDTEALRRCVAAARRQGRPVWVPAGDYQITGDIVVPSGVTIQGAGMWYTTFVGDAALYDRADRRVRFKLTGRDIRLADFAILGRLNYRVDEEANDGILGAGCADSTVARVWIEHTKVGVWIYNGTNLRIEGCRFRDLLADGINLCVGTSGTVVENCSARGTGDDCFAIWPTPSDQGYVGAAPRPGHNVIRRCTGQLPFLANGGSLYGGDSNRIEDCLFTDISAGCGILISTTFPTADEARRIDNNFSGTTVVRDCTLLRCGGYDHAQGWRAAFQICLDRRSLSGLAVSRVEIRDSLSDGLSVVAPGRRNGQNILSDTRLERVEITNYGLGAPNRHGLWIREDAAGGLTIVDSRISDIRNDSTSFRIAGGAGSSGMPGAKTP